MNLGRMQQTWDSSREFYRNDPLNDVAVLNMALYAWGLRKDNALAEHFDNMLIQHAATRRGIGIGYFPCFVGDADPELLRLSDPVPSLDAWLLSHRDLRAAARMRAFRNFVMRHAKEIQATLEGTTAPTMSAENT